MPLDAVCISALCRELGERIKGGKIEKVQQPERDMLLLSLRAGRENLRLLIAAGPGNARVHITEAAFENPAEPPMFCMLMRKHLTGSRIAKLIQPEHERMIIFELECFDELGTPSRKKLVVEMIGRSSNLVLLGEDGRIIDCIRRADFGGDALRRMLPGMIYRMPPKQAKTPFFDSDASERQALILSADTSKPADKWLMDVFSGLSPLVCRELAYRSGGDYSALQVCLEALYETVQAGEMKPVMLFRDGKCLDFSFMFLSQYGDSVSERLYPDFSALLDAFYSQRDRLEQQRRRGKELTHSVKNQRDRLQRKLAGQRQELERTEGREEVRKRAELVTANIYRMKKGDRSLECEDYYQEDCPLICIELDPLKTPQQNAAALYKEYGKLKGARKHLTVLIHEGEHRLDYLNSVLDELERAESEKDLRDIRAELVQAGFLRGGKSPKKDRGKTQAPFRLVTDDGLEMLVGRSNIQNDELTTKIARRSDYWFHTRLVHGSHVILCCMDDEPPQRSIEQAAAAAVFFSQARAGGKTAVDYAMVKNVRKPSGAMPGKVIYTDYHTIIAESSEELINRLKKT